jgi:outer membrane receptor for ferric coprogen and ferric-rhodotorulic acid
MNHPKIDESASLMPAFDRGVYRRVLACLVASGLASLLPAQTAPAGTTKPAPAEPVPVVKTTDNAGNSGEVVQLSPFEVVADTNGYYSANTMSGTRFNTKLDDMASSITVMTKGQMSDFGMLDINDIFLYVAGTEGTGTYTDYSLDRNGSLSDNVQINPTQANRVRGIAPANVSLGNIETMGRVPVDPIAIESVEISRGPNANVFGLGNPSGTVTMVPASANLSRNRATTGFRGDSTGGWRTSLDVNRVLLKDKLAIRGMPPSRA